MKYRYLDRNITGELFGDATPDNLVEQKIALGSLFSLIEEAEASYRLFFEEFFGEEPTDSLVARPYGRSPEEESLDLELADRIFSNLDIKDSPTRSKPDSKSRLYRLTNDAVALRQEFFEDVTPDDIDNEMRFSDLLEDRLLVDNAKSVYFEDGTGADCAMSSFAFCALAIDGRYKRYNYRQAKRSLQRRGFDKSTYHDSSRLMRMLPHTNPEVGVNVITTIGMGVPEIESKIVDRLIEKKPNLEFGLNFQTVSDEGNLMNHVFTLTGVKDGEPVLYRDSSNTSMSVANTDFARRWFASNMLANIVVVNRSE